MLNENLSKVRKERGLTQEALAVKLNVVRQTISKWENGTAVPDADMLCRIAEALEVSVVDLLGSPVKDEKMDMTAIAKSLAEINEQLAIRNRRSSKVLKIICGVLIGLFVLIAIVIVLNISVRPPVIEDSSVVVKVESDEEENTGMSMELDKNGVPLFSQVRQEAENDMREFFGSKTLTDKQLIQSWGNPINENGSKMSWRTNDDKVFTVFFDDAHYAYDCGIESR